MPNYTKEKFCIIEGIENIGYLIGEYVFVGKFVFLIKYDRFRYKWLSAVIFIK